MRKPLEPWHRYERTHYRLERWADWIHGKYPECIGWNVYQGDSEQGNKVQLRNDEHSDRVYQEVANMTRDEAEVWTTETAWRQLPRIWRHLLWVLYVRDSSITKNRLADAVGIDRRAISSHLWGAFDELDNSLIEHRKMRDPVEG